MANNANKLTALEVLSTSRPLWWVTTMVPFVAGYALADPGLGWPLTLGALYFAFCYNLLMYGINDIFDYESDIRNPRKSGVLAKAKHRTLWSLMVVTNVPFWVYFAMQGGAWAMGWLALMVCMVVAYSVRGLRFKEVPFLDSFTSAFHYTSPFLFGVLLGGGDNLWLPAFLTFFVWAMGNHALGAIQDILPDRAAGISSVATRLGAEKTLVFVLSAYLTAVILPTLYYGWKGVAVSVVLLWYVGLAVTALPFRMHEGHPFFRHMWRLLTLMNYICGGIVSVYLIVLAHAVR